MNAPRCQRVIGSGGREREADGARPSSGAEGLMAGRASVFPSALGIGNLAAPEDGRTPCPPLTISPVRPQSFDRERPVREPAHVKIPRWFQGRAILFALLLATCTEHVFGALLDSGFDVGTRADADILAMAVQEDGRIIAVGEFTTIGGTNRNRVVRLNPDGSVDLSFATGTGSSGTVRAVAIQSDGKIVVGGNFLNSNAGISCVVRLNPDGSGDASFVNVTVTILSSARVLAVQPDGRIILGGTFTEVGGVSRARIARLNTNGSLDTSFNPGTGLNDFPRAMLLQPDGKILVAGKFTAFNDLPAGRIVRLLTNGSIDPDFNAGIGAEDQIRALSRDTNGRIYIGGDFEMFNGTNRSGVARLFANGGLDLSFDQGNPASDTINTVAVGPDGKVWIGGLFQQAGGQPRGLLARLNENGTADPSVNVTFDNRAGDEMYALKFQSDGLLLMAGEFRSVNNVTRHRMARLVTPEAPTLIRLGPASFTSGLEGSTLTFTVERIGRTNAAASASFSTQNGSALAGLDFTATNGTVQFAPGEISKTIFVSLLADLVFDPNEEFWMALSNLQGAAASVPLSATVHIMENSPKIEIVTTHSYNFSEGVSPDSTDASVAFVQFQRTGYISGQSWSVNYEIIPGTATHEQDFTGPLPGTVDFTSGNDFRSIQIPLVNDGRREPAENFTVRLTGAVGAVIAANNAATVTILNDDWPVEWVASQWHASETSGTTEVAIRRNDNGPETISVGYTITGDTTSADDFATQQGTLTFAPLEKTKALTVTILDDCRIEWDESVNLVLTEAVGGAGLGENSTGRLIIQDNERPGSFDLKFGTNGSPVIPSGPIALHTDGTVLVGSMGALGADGRVFRLLRDGTIDPHFAGTNFMPRLLGLGANLPQQGVVESLHVQPNGSIIVRGRTEAPPFPAGYFRTNHLTRLHADGRPDSSFALDTRVVLPRGPLILQPAPDGKVLIAADARSDAGQSLGSHLLRLNRDGSLDTTFQGSLQSPFQFHTPLRALAAQPDGRILVAGVFLRGGNVFPGLLRLTPDGSMDGQFAPVECPWVFTFSTNPEPRSIVIQPDGRILIAGHFARVNSSAKTNLARILPDGEVDDSLQIEEPLQINYNSQPLMGLDADGRILIQRDNYQSFQPVARLLRDGRRDPSFSMNERPSPFDVSDMVVTEAGKIIVANYSGLFRLNGDAMPEIIFTPGPDGTGWRLSTSAITGDTYRLQSTRDFLSWETLQTKSAEGCSADFLVGPDLAPQFYRIERALSP